jgi:hypothetical protein
MAHRVKLDSVVRMAQAELRELRARLVLLGLQEPMESMELTE